MGWAREARVYSPLETKHALQVSLSQLVARIQLRDE